MKKASSQYKRAMASQLRNRSYMIVSIGVVSNEAQVNGRVTSLTSYLSNNKDLFKDISVANNYATFEQGVFKLDGSLLLAPEQTGYEQLASDICCMSKNIGGNIVITFDKAYNIKGLTITFGEYYPTEFTINGTTYTNDSEQFTCDDNFDLVDSITITPVHFTGGDSKRLRIESILMGVGLTFRNEDIESASFTDSASFISEELPQLDFNVTCFDRYKRFNVDDSNSFINYLEAGQEITTSLGIELDDGTIEYIQMPTTYLSNWSSNTEKIAFTSVDRIAFLTAKYTAGNTIHSRSLYDDAVAVLTYAGLEPDEYEIPDLLRSINVVNPLPEVSCAECLQLIANASRCLLKQNDLGMISFIPNFENILEPEDLNVSGCNTNTAWSIVDNVKTAASTVYADFSHVTLDNTELLLPENVSQATDTGYVSSQIADANGNFFDNLLPTPYGGTRTQSGVTFTYNEDGSVHAEGICTADTWYYFHSNGGYNPWMISNCPWNVDDVTQVDYFIEGSITGYIGITWGYKNGSSSATQGYIVNRSNQYFEMKNCRVKFSDIRRQTIDPLFPPNNSTYLTAYIYVKKGCEINATISPVLSVRHHMNNLIDGYYFEHSRWGVDNIFEQNGITFTLLDDGSIKVNGTATAEADCRLVNPYAANTRKILELGHTYKLSEGRETDSYHTNPYVQFVRYNTETETYDYAINTTLSGGEKTFTADDETLLGYGVRITVPSGKTVNNVIVKPTLIDVDDYDDTEVVPTHYFKGYKPKMRFELPTIYTYYGMHFQFACNPPTEFIVRTYAKVGNDYQLIDEVVATNVTQDYHFSYPFYRFEAIEIEFTKGLPNSRIYLQKFNFENLTDYKVVKEDMNTSPVGTINPKTKSVGVRVFTFENDPSTNLPRRVEDEVWYTHNLNPVGEAITFENQLISTQSHAEDVAKWIANYYANNITYEVSYRGEPRIESADFIYLDSDILNNLQVEVDSCSIEYNGSIRGVLHLSRAVNLIST